MKDTKVRQVAGLGLLTAIVVILQFMGSFIRFGVFSISLVLIPIVVGAATYKSKWAGAWLGFIFGVVVLISGDAAAFLAVNAPGTVVTVLLKGTLCGFLAGLIYHIVAKKNESLAVVLAAITAPIVNTGVFLIGCRLFFYDTVSAWAIAAGFENAASYMFIGLAGGNFLVELLVNALLSPVIIRIIGIGKKTVK